MRKFVISLFLASVATLVLAALSAAGGQGSTVWSAKLTAAQEFPAQAFKNTAASGSFTATLSGTQLTFKLTFTKLSGPPSMAHIHLGAMGVSGPVKVWLCGMGSPDSQLVAAHPCTSPMSGTVTVTPALQQDFAKHLLYVNVHTAKNPNGEIRGQLAR